MSLATRNFQGSGVIEMRLIRENTRLKKKLKEHNDMLKWHQGGW